MKCAAVSFQHPPDSSVIAYVTEQIIDTDVFIRDHFFFIKPVIIAFSHTSRTHSLRRVLLEHHRFKRFSRSITFIHFAEIRIQARKERFDLSPRGNSASWIALTDDPLFNGNRGR